MLIIHTDTQHIYTYKHVHTPNAQTQTHTHTRPHTQDTAFNSSTPTFSTSILMGKRDEPLLTICARRIVEAASHAGCMTPMIICLGLREHSPEVLREVCKAVGEDNVWL